ncbi:MFS transporter [Streptomyces sp. NPDC046805]|uniref:MFS transporter n=1 Tax=Streptomyces sp. NPDC046805 TaxID=3155134 RepID=UPI0033FDD93C
MRSTVEPSTPSGQSSTPSSRESAVASAGTHPQRRHRGGRGHLTRAGLGILPPGRHRGGQGHLIDHGAGFWVTAYAFLVAMAFTTVPTPLYPIYQQRDGFSMATITVIFASYAVGVMVSLYVAGHASDWLGRRRILVPALLLAAASAAVFLVWQSLTGLLVGRVLSGLAVGVTTSTATAHLAELHARARPGAPRRRAEVVAGVANLGGLGLGTLISGLLAEYAPSPLRLPYLLFAVLLVIGAVGMSLVAETVDPPEEAPRYRVQKISVPREARAVFGGACLLGLFAFAVLGLFTSLAPSFLVQQIGTDSHVVAGLTVFALFGAAAGGQVAVGSLGTRRTVAVSTVLLPLGMAVSSLGVALADLGMFTVGGVIVGIGTGLAFKSALSTVAGLVDAGSRGEVLAGLFLSSYVGLAVPAIGLGVLTQHMSATGAFLLFAGVLSVGAVASGAVMRLRIPTP